MTFDDVWKQVTGLPDTAMMQVPRILSDSTKNTFSRMPPEDVSRIVAEAIEEVNSGGVIPLDKLIQKRL